MCGICSLTVKEEPGISENWVQRSISTQKKESEMRLQKTA
jgi:hypothetical protein